MIKSEVPAIQGGIAKINANQALILKENKNLPRTPYQVRGTEQALIREWTCSEFS